MRWLQTVGMVRWCRIHPDLQENLSGGVGFVRWCRIGLWDFPWDFLDGNRVGSFRKPDAIGMPPCTGNMTRCGNPFLEVAEISISGDGIPILVASASNGRDC